MVRFLTSKPQHAHEHRGHQELVVAGHLADHDDGGDGNASCGCEEACHAHHCKSAWVRHQSRLPSVEDQSHGAASEPPITTAGPEDATAATDQPVNEVVSILAQAMMSNEMTVPCP